MPFAAVWSPKKSAAKKWRLTRWPFQKRTPQGQFLGPATYTHQVWRRSVKGPLRSRGTNRQTDKRCSNYSMISWKGILELTQQFSYVQSSFLRMNLVYPQFSTIILFHSTSVSTNHWWVDCTIVKSDDCSILLYYVKSIQSALSCTSSFKNLILGKITVWTCFFLKNV